MATKQTIITATVYPQNMSCGAGSSTYTVATIPLSTLAGSIVSIDAIELRGVRTSGSGAIDTFSGYTYPFKAGSSTERYATNFTAATIKSWVETYGFVDMPVHLGFKAESGSGIGTYYGNIYLSLTLTYDAEGGSEVNYYTSEFKPSEVLYFIDGDFVECDVSYYTSGAWHEV